MADLMHLLFVIKGLVVQGGGAERVFVDIVNELQARRHAVTIATFDEPGQNFFYDIDPEIPRCFMGASRPGEPTPRSGLIQVAGSVRSLARSMRPDAAVAFMHSTYVPVAFGLAGTSVPLIASEHTTAAHFTGRPVERILARWAQRMSYAKTVVSSQIFDEHPPAWRNNVRILPNPVDFSAFAAARAAGPSKKVILCVGGLRPEKDQATLIAAFDQIAAAFPEWRLRLVGDGIERPTIERRVSASPFHERIELPGVIRDVASEYAKTSIVVMPSRHESLGMVAIEAMASGRPVIGFRDCVGAATLIQDGTNGLLVDPSENRVQALAAALRTLMSNQELRLRMGAAAPATVEGYALDAITTQWEDLLSEAAASRSNRSHAKASSSGRTKNELRKPSERSAPHR